MKWKIRAREATAVDHGASCVQSDRPSVETIEPDADGARDRSARPAPRPSVGLEPADAGQPAGDAREVKAGQPGPVDLNSAYSDRPRTAVEPARDHRFVFWREGRLPPRFHRGSPRTLAA